MSRSVLVLAFVAFIVLVIAFLPWVLFWAIGTLFGFAIEVTWKTWLAAWVLMVIAGGTGAS